LSRLTEEFEREQAALSRVVTRDYFPTVGARLREGRFFEISDTIGRSTRTSASLGVQTIEQIVTRQLTVPSQNTLLLGAFALLAFVTARGSTIPRRPRRNSDFSARTAYAKSEFRFRLLLKSASRDFRGRLRPSKG
jgi:hypothetical protein